MMVGLMSRGGKRPGAGRKPGAAPRIRSKPVYCGKLTPAERKQILYGLTPAARRLALLDAVGKWGSGSAMDKAGALSRAEELDKGE
jgi:hypothetical protein